MSRPAQLLLIAMVYIFGTIIALAVGSRFNWVPFLYGLLTLIPASASVDYANEYADYETDNLTVRTDFSGGSGALQLSGLPRRLALISAWVALSIGITLVLIGWTAGLLNGYAIVILVLGTFFWLDVLAAPFSVGLARVGRIGECFFRRSSPAHLWICRSDGPHRCIHSVRQPAIWHTGILKLTCYNLAQP